LLLVFVAVMALVLFLMTSLGGPPEVTVWPDGPQLGAPEAMRSEARPGIDGLLSVSVRPSVEVLVDGRSHGNGAFAKYPLEHGMHKVILKEGARKETLTIHIKANKEEFIAPADWQ
jgi:hypothetical protein